jgi:glucosamine kinase
VPRPTNGGADPGPAGGGPGPGPWVLGVDIGGTKSRARLVVGEEVVAEALSASASVAAEGPEAALAALDDLLGRVPLPSSRPLDAVCAGVAGMLRGRSLGLFTARLGALAAGGPVLVVGDGALVLPAAGFSEGVGIICGTGTVAFARHDGRQVTAGGWGYLLGDDGSGYWVFRRALRSVLDRCDRGRPLGPLGDALLEAVGARELDDLRAAVYGDPRPGRWAALAPAVLGSGDPEVANFLTEGAQGIGDLVDASLEALGRPAGLPIVLAGGMTSEPRFNSAVTTLLLRRWPDSPVSQLGPPPVVGAVRLAQEAAHQRA